MHLESWMGMLQVLSEDTEEILQSDSAISLYTHLRWPLTPKRRNIRRIWLHAASSRSVRNVGMEEYILEVVEGQPKISIRRLEGHIGTIHLSVLGTLQEQQLYPYHIQCVHVMNLLDMNYVNEFCSNQPETLHLQQCFTHWWILLHYDWDHQHSQRTRVIRIKS